MHLQEQYGNDKVMALMGNHEDMVIGGESTIDSMYGGMQWYDNENADDLYISWLSSLPRYYTEGNTIFVHAGIDETVGDMWEWETSDDIYTSKYPAETGRIEGLDMKVDYALDMNQEHVADCYLAIKAQPKDCKNFTI